MSSEMVKELEGFKEWVNSGGEGMTLNRYILLSEINAELDRRIIAALKEGPIA